MAKVSSFRTFVAGVKYRQGAVMRCRLGQPVKLIRDPTNAHDKNAIEVWCGYSQIGFIRRDEAEGLAPSIDEGDRVQAIIHQLVGPDSGKPFTGVVLAMTLTPRSLL